MSHSAIDVSTPAFIPGPVRALATDDPAEILGFAAACLREGVDVALATLVEIRGGAARALGSHVAVAADGRYCGYVSGGCVEAAVASEALLAMAEGRDRTVMFGDGSPFFDIVLPCGGGISVAIHLLREGTAIEQALDRLRNRQPAGLRYNPERQSLRLVDAPERACWQADDFLTIYRPRTRLVISGQTVEASVVARLGAASDFEVFVRAAGRSIVEDADAFTAIVFLHHDLDQEAPVLEAALGSPAFYVGALGSTRTQRRRVERLRERGFGSDDLSRIKAPIGIFGPTRDSTSLALSILADVAACRLATYG
ncbi:hypothetical protein ATY78_06825 [Rhizobium sp. R635]|uniref:XdhC family protein n=1 Tax=Rhizobium sp. R635 TaxID=1764275 RepID=UPI000B533E38|nr:XdhC family protein [Rhizobium sp. R635]OWV80398.1 hypothetical protein ATY78_06825 [Rhizobium sp. R635]